MTVEELLKILKKGIKDGYVEVTDHIEVRNTAGDFDYLEAVEVGSVVRLHVHPRDADTLLGSNILPRISK